MPFSGLQFTGSAASAGNPTASNARRPRATTTLDIPAVASLDESDGRKQRFIRRVESRARRGLVDRDLKYIRLVQRDEETEHSAQASHHLHAHRGPAADYGVRRRKRPRSLSTQLIGIPLLDRQPFGVHLPLDPDLPA